MQVGEIITRFENKGFVLKGLKLFQCPEDLAKVRLTDACTNRSIQCATLEGWISATPCIFADFVTYTETHS